MKQANFFEVMNFITGRTMTNMFEIKPKKKDALSMPSPFQKKKQPFKIQPSGSLIPFFFYTNQDPIEVFDIVLEEMTKFQDPIIIPESQTFRLIATYYKIKPTVGQQTGVVRSKSPNRKRGGSKMNSEELNNKITEIVF